jgi:GT2 family glycosyltransferase
MPRPKDSVAVLILNYNGWQDTLNCLDSLLTSPPDKRIFPYVLDNGSADGSIQKIRQRFPDIPIFALGQNLGFAEGNNRGIQWALNKGFQWIFLLNNDTLVAPDCIDKLLQTARAHPEAKILGAASYEMARPSHLDHCGGYFDPTKAEFVSYKTADAPRPVEYVSGCALFMHRSVPETIGLLEPRYFLYWEEADYCLRAWRANLPVWTAPEARIWHKVSSSFRGNKAVQQYYWWRSRLLFLERNLSPFDRAETLRRIVWPEARKFLRHYLLKSLQSLVSTSIPLIQKKERLLHGLLGIRDYYLSRFGPL